MSKWLKNSSTNKLSNFGSRPVKMVKINIQEDRKPTKKEIQIIKNNNAELCCDVYKPEESILSIDGDERRYYGKIEVVDVKTLSQDIKKLLQDTSAKIRQEKLSTILGSLNVINRQCVDMTQRLTQYEDRIKCLETISTTLSDQNKQLEEKVYTIEKLVNKSEEKYQNDCDKSGVCITVEEHLGHNCIEESKSNHKDLNGNCKNTNENFNFVVNDTEEVDDMTKVVNEITGSKGEKRDKDMKVKIMLWHMKQKMKATYKFKWSKDGRSLLKNDDSGSKNG